MALIDEDKLQGNIIEILRVLRTQQACCDQVAAAFWAASSVAGDVFVTVARGGAVTVYNQPGGTKITDYGTLTPS